AFGFLVQYRIDDLMFYFLWIVRTGKVDEMRGILGDGTVVAQFLDLGNVVFHSYEFHVTVLDLPRTEPYVHHQQHQSADQKRDVSSMNEFVHQGYEIAKLDNEI